MVTVTDRDPSEVLSGLTDKQVEVLDRLLQHKTSKQIARELGISPSTVNARIETVRERWGTTDRNATARVYAHLLESCNKFTCEFSPLESDVLQGQGFLRELPGSPVFAVADAQTWHRAAGPGRQGFLEALDTRFGKVGRLGAALALAFLLMATVVLSLAVAAGIEKLVRA